MASQLELDDVVIPLLAAAAVVATLALAGSAHAESRPAAPAPELRAGTWTFGSGDQPEPKSAVVELEPNCYGASKTMEVTRKGDAVKVHLAWFPGVGGAAPRYTYDEHEDTSGTLDGGKLILTGTHVLQIISAQPRDPEARKTATPVRYDLRLNERGHLVGTVTTGDQKAVPFWAAPSRPTTSRAPCGPPPP